TSPWSAGLHNAPTQLVDCRIAGAPPQRASRASLSPDARIGGVYQSTPTLFDTLARTTAPSIGLLVGIANNRISWPWGSTIKAYGCSSCVVRSVRVSVPVQSGLTV